LVLKFQKALNSNSILVTDKNMVYGEYPLTKEVDKYFGDAFKFYANCAIRGSKIAILSKVEDGE
jgi:hypothetical protein